MRCETCRPFQDKIRGTKNFFAAWITGCDNQKLSNVLGHAHSDQQKLLMSLLRVEQAKATNALLEAFHLWKSGGRTVRLYADLTKVRVCSTTIPPSGYKHICCWANKKNTYAKTLFFAARMGCMVWWYWLNWQRYLWQLNSVLMVHTEWAARCITEAFQSHLCSTYRGLWWLVVVRVS